MAKILLVDDDENNRDMLRRRLEKRHFDVLLAIDGAAAVSAANEHLPDIILMDLTLPILSGLEATRCLKRTLITKDIPIIALTAHAMSSDHALALSAGCSDYDTKPVDMERLLSKIQALLTGLRSDQ